MTVNFKIETNSALTHEGKHIDIHNNFDFIGYDHNIADRQLKLFWTKSSGDWVSEDELPKLTLIHFNVSYLSIKYDNKKYEFPNDDKCLGEISFFPSSKREINNAHIPQDLPKDGDDIIYIFETEHFIRIGCEKIAIVVG